MPLDCSNSTATICTDFCRFSSDTDCDDGGPGSEYTLCNFGDDCIDCGPRPARDGALCAPTPPPPPAPIAPPPPLVAPLASLVRLAASMST
eukprot:4102030-Prymnesium_polylepis.1